MRGYIRNNRRMRLQNAALVELQPTNRNSVAVQPQNTHVTSSAIQSSTEDLPPKKQRTNSLAGILEQFGGNITINLNNVTAPIHMFNQASGHRSNGSVVLGSYFIL